MLNSVVVMFSLKSPSIIEGMFITEKWVNNLCSKMLNVVLVVLGDLLTTAICNIQWFVMLKVAG